MNDAAADPRDARDPRHARALALDAERRGAEAAALLRELLADRPDDVDALALLGTVLAQDGFADAALAPLERAAALRPGSAGIQNNLGLAYAALGRDAAALDCYARSLAQRPDHPRTLANRARVLRRLGRDAEADADLARADEATPRDREAWAAHAAAMLDRAQRSGRADDLAAAARAYRRARDEGAIDPVAADFALAAFGHADVPASAPAAYVERLFDQYAERFDEHLRERLHYRTPEQLVATLAACEPPPSGWPGEVVDLGCGTGLLAPLAAPFARRLVGVDLSARMLDAARRRGGYATLAHGDVVEHLAARPGAYDAALAADVLVYIGDLAPLFGAAARALRPGGLFAFSVERHDAPDGFVLLPSRRYAHADAYLFATAASTGLRVERCERAVLRHDLGRPVEGTLVVARRAAGVPEASGL